MPYAHTGAGVALLGSAFGRDQYVGTLTSTGLGPLAPGGKYVVQFFYSSIYSGEEMEAAAFLDVSWNGIVVGSVRVGYSPWTYFSFPVEALGGNDTLAFIGGVAPAYVFIDDIQVFLE